MVEIGQKLKERREDLGFTLDEIQERTKITTQKLKAIESGNLEYFKHELSYLRFYIQYYAQTIHLPFSEIEQDLNKALDDYSETMILKRNELKEVSNENIKKRMEKNQKQYQASNLSSMSKKSLQTSRVSSVIMTILSIAIVALLIWGVINFVIPMFNSEPQIPSIPDVPIVNNNNNSNNNENDVEEPDITEPEPAIEPSITMIDPTTYEVNIYGIEEPKFTLNLGSETWIAIYLNDVVTNNPATRIYNNGETLELLIDPAVDQSVLFHMGTMLNNQFLINDTPIVMDETIANNNAGTRITFILVQEEPIPS